jgi:hypothetical protein
MYSTCFERQTLIIRSPLTVHTASSFLCWCLSAALFCKKLTFGGASVCIDRFVTCIHLTKWTVNVKVMVKVKVKTGLSWLWIKVIKCKVPPRPPTPDGIKWPLKVGGAAGSKGLTASEAKKRVMPGSDIRGDALQFPPQLTLKWAQNWGGVLFCKPHFLNLGPGKLLIDGIKWPRYYWCIHLTNRSIQTDAPPKASFLQDSAADRHQHRKLEAVCTVKGLLMMGAWRSKHVEYIYR